MAELSDFGGIVLLVASAFGVAVVLNKLTDWVPVPIAGVFLVAAAVASDVFPSLADALSTEGVERVAVVALVVILFDGGMRVGWRRFRVAAAPVTLLGVAGTFATAAVIAVAARVLFDFEW